VLSVVTVKQKGVNSSSSRNPQHTAMSQEFAQYHETSQEFRSILLFVAWGGKVRSGLTVTIKQQVFFATGLILLVSAN